MFKRKEQKFESVYDRQWNQFVHDLFRAENGIDNIYADIQYSLNILSCFEENSPNWNSENEHLKELRRKLLCECGEYDLVSEQLRLLYHSHKEELQPEFCINYRDLISCPFSDCNEYLRGVARNFKKNRLAY